jgi:hypothetical protein
MSKQEEKRARIIAMQLAREAADRAAGRLPNIPEPRSNWASTPSKRPRKMPGRPPSRGR